MVGNLPPPPPNSPFLFLLSCSSWGLAGSVFFQKLLSHRQKITCLGYNTPSESDALIRSCGQDENFLLEYDTAELYTAKKLYRNFETNIPRNKTARPRSEFLHSCICERFIPPGSVCLFCCRKIVGLILGIYKWLTDTCMWKLRTRPHFWEYINRIFFAV